MGFFSRIKAGRLYRMLDNNKSVYPDKNFNKEHYIERYKNNPEKAEKISKKKQKYILFIQLSNDLMGIFFKYKINSGNISEEFPMRVYYEHNKDYMFDIEIMSLSDNCKNEYFYKNLKEAENPDIFLKQILYHVSRTVNIMELRGKQINSELLTEDGTIEGFKIKMTETFYDDKSNLRMHLYNDLEGLAKICLCAENTKVNEPKKDKNNINSIYR